MIFVTVLLVYSFICGFVTPVSIGPTAQKISLSDNNNENLTIINPIESTTLINNNYKYITTSPTIITSSQTNLISVVKFNNNSNNNNNETNFSILTTTTTTTDDNEAAAAAVTARTLPATTISTNLRQINECSNVRTTLEQSGLKIELPLIPVDGSGVCGDGHSCCGAEVENELKKSATLALHTFLKNNFVSIRGMLASTANALHVNIRKVATRSEKNTVSTFTDVYTGMYEHVKQPLTNLYRSLSDYLDNAERIPSEVPSNDAIILQDIVMKFYKELFPLVYHEVVHHLKTQQFTQSYKTCLIEHVDTISPYGANAHKMAANVAQSFETTKVLIQALTLGLEILNTTDEIMSKTSESCREALLRLYYCPKCLGISPSVKPCNNFCLNVMRGCLTQQHTTELDLPWSHFLMETQKLVKEVRDGQLPNIGEVLSGFSSAISDAIMYATLNSPAITAKVAEHCGTPKLMENNTAIKSLKSNEARQHELVKRNVDTSTAAITNDNHIQDNKNQSTIKNSPIITTSILTTSTTTPTQSNIWTPLNSFLETLDRTKARELFANLAELLCSDESFAETRDTADCWNGHRIGEYTKELVRPGVDAQKYNPEMSWSDDQLDPRIEQLSEKLRHMRQVVVSRLIEKRGLESDSLIKNEGSGSGAGPSGGSWPSDDEEYEQSNWYEGSGSGDHATRVIEDSENTANVASAGDTHAKNIPTLTSDRSAATKIASYSSITYILTSFIIILQLTTSSLQHQHH